MKSTGKYFVFLSTFALSVFFLTGCFDKSESTQTYSFTFEDGTMTYAGLVDANDTTKGSYWDVHMYQEGTVLETNFRFVTEWNDSSLNTGTYPCAGYNLTTVPINTYLAGTTDASGAPKYSYAITATDGTKLFYYLFSDGNMKVSRELVKDVYNYSIQGTASSYGVTMNISFSGELKKTDD